VKFLKSLQDQVLEIDLLFYLFDQFSLCMSTHKSSKANSRSTSTITTKVDDPSLLEIERNLEKTSLQINLKIIYSTLLSALLSQIEPQLIVDNHERVLDFCHCLLKNILNDLDEEGLLFDLESVHLTLSLISVFTTGVVALHTELKHKLKIFLPLLDRLRSLKGRETNETVDIGEMAESLFISIGTHCGIKSESLSAKKGAVPLIEEMDDVREEVEEKNSQGGDEYERAMNDVKDPLVPVKAHGLVVLRKLIDARNERCLANKDTLVEIFMKYLKHDDSYIYLAAINCLIR
jgi:hypothetical protein